MTDPSATLAAPRGSALNAGFSPYQISCLSRSIPSFHEHVAGNIRGDRGGQKSVSSLRGHPYPYLSTKIFELRSNCLGYCSPIAPTFSRRFNIGIDPVNKIEMWLTAFLNITNEIWIADGGFAKKMALIPLSQRSARKPAVLAKILLDGYPIRAYRSYSESPN